MPVEMKKWTNPIMIVLLLGAAMFRLIWYGSPMLSVGMPDTPSYIASSAAPVFSWQAFTRQRLFTTNLLYKLIKEKSCVDIPISAPALKRELFREAHVCFMKIALFQNLMSVTAWTLLAWMISRQVASLFAKFLSVIIIPLFGFTPQIAEWDSVLSSESISVSLFILSLAGFIWFVFEISKQDGEIQLNAKNVALISIWLCAFLLWVFTRDVNLTALPVTILLLAFLVFKKSVNSIKIISVLILILASALVLGFASSRQSLRQYIPLKNLLAHYIIPYSARVEFFVENGMPAGEEREKWIQHSASIVYLKFLVTHPGFVATTLIQHAFYFESDFTQPYYKSPENKNRDILLLLGQVLHPQTNAVFLVGSLLLTALIVASVKNQDKRTRCWAWTAGWFFASASASLFLSFFGDADGVTRHIYPAVESFRLFMWIYLITMFDLSITRE